MTSATITRSVHGQHHSAYSSDPWSVSRSTAARHMTWCVGREEELHIVVWESVVVAYLSSPIDAWTGAA